MGIIGLRSNEQIKAPTRLHRTGLVLFRGTTGGPPLQFQAAHQDCPSLLNLLVQHSLETCKQHRHIATCYAMQGMLTMYQALSQVEAVPNVSRLAQHLNFAGQFRIGKNPTVGSLQFCCLNHTAGHLTTCLAACIQIIHDLLVSEMFFPISPMAYPDQSLVACRSSVTASSHQIPHLYNMIHTFLRTPTIQRSFKEPQLGWPALFGLGHLSVRAPARGIFFSDAM